MWISLESKWSQVCHICGMKDSCMSNRVDDTASSGRWKKCYLDYKILYKLNDVIQGSAMKQEDFVHNLL